MSEPDRPGVIDSLPHHRPQRRSDKRSPRRPAQPPRADPPDSAPSAPDATPGSLATVLQAACELAGVGLQLAAEGLRRLAQRLP
ncbi:MAG: hypothetical protein ACRDMJ_15305 [Solirubrobacteraceae bacterium]